jgi:hypothetical protein
MRAATLALLVLAGSSCTGDTTPVGQLGAAEDLRRHLPAERLAHAPRDEHATRFEHDLDVHGVATKLIWYAWNDGPHQYLLSTRWEVVRPHRGVTLEALGAQNPINAGTTAAVVEATNVRLRWREDRTLSTHFGERSVRIDASGHAAAL